MNGPEHYREAETWLRIALTDSVELGIGAQTNYTVAMAQVHATLAMAAAVIDAGSPRTSPWIPVLAPEVAQ